MTKEKGQTTMILIIIVILMFAGVAIFLLTFAKNINQTSYLNDYTHSLLLSVMRSDTGYTDPNCKLVSDALACSFFSPGYICGGGPAASAASLGGPTCLDLANQTVTDYISRFGMIKKSYRYLMVVEPYGFTKIDENTGEPFKIKIGDQSLLMNRTTKYTANEAISKITSSGSYTLNAILTIALKNN